MRRYTGNAGFTLFIVLPWDEVCSVRNLPSGVTVKGIYCRLELLAGCPAYTYNLVSPDGKVLEDDQPLVLSVNVWDGYMIRVEPLDKWIPVYDGVRRGNLEWFISNGKEDVEKGDNPVNGGAISQGDDDLGAVALYLSCWLGHNRLSSRLLESGVDPNAVTPFGRSSMFACIVKDNEMLLTILMYHGARSDLRDFLGDTALDIGKKNMSRQCVNLIHSFHINHLPNGSDATISKNSDFDMTTYPRPIPVKFKDPTRRTQSAKITMDINVTLGNNIHRDSASKNPRSTRKAMQCPAMLRSNTYSNGFHPRKDNIKTHPRVCTSTNQVPLHHSSQTLSTPRNLKYFPEVTSSSAASTPRSATGMATLRVASPQSNYHNKPNALINRSNNNNNRVKWVEPVAYPEMQFHPSNSQTRNGHGGKMVNASPSSVAANSPADSNQTKHYIGQSSSSLGRSSPRCLKDPIVVSKSEPEVDEQKEVEDENDTGNGSDVNGAEHEKEHSEDGNSKTKSLTPKTPKRNRIWKSGKQMEIKRKERENHEVAKRRIQLLETQKRDRKKKESFEQWLRKKQRQKRQEESSGDSDDSSDDEKERKRSNIEAFNNWLKELDERSIKQINPNSAISLNKRKTRALRGLIGISDTTFTPENNREVVEDTSKYMHSYQKWIENKAKEKENKPEMREFDERKARKCLNSMRNDVLAEAISFEEWMEHAEDRKRLTDIISQSKRRLSEETDSQKRCQSAKKTNIPFEKWKQELEAKEAKRKIAQLRMRRQQEKEKNMRENDRVSTAIPHDAWVQKKLQMEKQEKEEQRHRNERQIPSKDKESKEDGGKKQVGFETWVSQKHEQELQRVNKNIQREQELQTENRQKKESQLLV